MSESIKILISVENLDLESYNRYPIAERVDQNLFCIKKNQNLHGS